MAITPVQVLIISDTSAEVGLIRSLFSFVPDYEVTVTEAANLRETEYALATRRFDLIILSADMRGGTAFGWLDELVRGQFGPVLVIEEHATIRRAVEAIRKGALDYYPKRDVSAQVLWNVLNKAMEQRPLKLGTVARPAGAVQPDQLSADRILRHLRKGDPESTSAPSERPPSGEGRDAALRGMPLDPAAAPAAERAQVSPTQSRRSADGEVQKERREKGLVYSTAGIDREMERLGIRRPWTVLQALPELREEIGRLLPKLNESPSPEVYREFRECAQRMNSGIHDDFELLSVLQSEYPSDQWAAGHSLNVCVLAMVIARHCEFCEEEVVSLGTAALIHGLGALDRGTLYDSAEAAAYAADVARKAGAPSNVILALEQMHEHADGSGSRGLRGREIVIDAQILLLADTLEHLYYRREEFFEKVLPGVLEEGRPPADPMFVVMNELRSWFQPRVLKALIFANGFYSTGSIVELNNGAVARVVAQNAQQPTQPVVEIIKTSLGESPSRPMRLDLSKTNGIAIRRVLSHNPPAWV